MSLKFEWNLDKAKKNTKKHGISFDEAATVFSDPLSMTKETVSYGKRNPLNDVSVKSEL